MSVTATYIIAPHGRITERFEDHLGNVFKQSYHPPAGWTTAQIEAHLEVARADIEVRLADGEADQVLS